MMHKPKVSIYWRRTSGHTHCLLDVCGIATHQRNLAKAKSSGRWRFCSTFKYEIFLDILEISEISTNYKLARKTPTKHSPIKLSLFIIKNTYSWRAIKLCYLIAIQTYLIYSVPIINLNSMQNNENI